MNITSARVCRVLLLGKGIVGLPELVELITKEGFELTCCDGAVEAWGELERRPYAVVIANEDLDGEPGLLFLRRVGQIHSAPSRVLVSNAPEDGVLAQAIKVGEITGLLTPPFHLANVVAALVAAIERYVSAQENHRLVDEVRDLKLQLGSQRREPKPENASVVEQVPSGGDRGVIPAGNFEHTLGLCFHLIGAFYPLVSKQIRAVVEICRAMSVSECFTPEERRVLMTSSWIYDLGVVALERSMLHKLFSNPESSTLEERALLRQHPVIGQTLASFLDRCHAVGEVVRAHHERYDGAGYPDGLGGENIPWPARCLGVAVAFVQSGKSKAEAAKYLESESGRAFDPEAVRLFFQTNPLEDLPENVREVLLAELKPGMRLARGLVSPTGMLLMPEGQELTGVAIDKLNNHSRLRLVTERILVYG